VVERFMLTNGIMRESVNDEWLIKLRGEAEKVLSGILGPSISSLIFKETAILTQDEKMQISDSVRRISSSLRLSRQELAEKNRQLALLKEFSENIIESVPLGIAMMDEHLHVKYWNNAMGKITGIKKTDAFNNHASLLLKCFEIDLFVPEVKEGEVICSRSLGSEPKVILKVYLNKLSGRQKGYVLVMEDITEKRKIEEELFRTTKHASIGRLAAGVSHEIGNPLASISSLVQELLSENLSLFASDSLGTINMHINRIARIVRSLGDFARLYPKQKVSTSLKDILQNTIDLVRYDKNFKKIEISTDVQDIKPVTIDPDEIQQVFLNLMLNSRDAMPDGGKIDIAIRNSNGFVEAVFTDTGTGIDKENRDKLFDPFFRQAL
jgi:PAS domain S-box-containing protein